MPNKNGTGPGVNSTGPHTGIGKGKGYHTHEKGTGAKTGAQKGDCK